MLIKDILLQLADVWPYLLSELWLLLLSVMLLLLDLFASRSGTKSALFALFLGLLVNMFLLQQVPVAEEMFYGVLAPSLQAVRWKMLANLGLLLALPMYAAFPLHTHRTAQEDGLGEKYVLLLAVLLGVQLLIVSRDLLLIFLSIELISLPSYALTAFGLNRRASEAAVKYLVVGVLSSAVMLYGMSLLYGLYGTLLLADLPIPVGTLPLLAWAMVLGGLLFKLSAAPFHFWAPDMYQGAPIAVVAYLSVVPKIGALALLLSMVSLPLSLPLLHLLLALGMASMLWGNLSALRQKNARVLMAYSAIAQAGFLLVGAATGNVSEGILYYYLLVYLLANYVLFLGIAVVERTSKGDSLEMFSGWGHAHRILPVLMVLAFVSQVGLPPTAGFSAKLLLFTAIGEAYGQTSDVWWLAALVVGLLNAAVSLYYYLFIPYHMYMKEGQGDTPAYSPWLAAYALLLGIPVVLLYVFPQWVL